MTPRDGSPLLRRTAGNVLPSNTHIPLPEEKRKQDCELKALPRLAAALKKDFPQTPICLTNDALYACGTAIQLAQDYGWEYFFVFKPGRRPTAWDEFQRLLPLCPENIKRLTLPDGTGQVYRWVNQLVHRDSQNRTHHFSAISCQETKADKTTTFAWITSFPVTVHNVELLAQKGGRARWQIENQGFNLQKNSNLNLSHPYSHSTKNLKAYYYLLQIAHIILQFLEVGSLLRNWARQRGKTPIQLFGSLKNIARLLRDCFRYWPLPEPAFDLSSAAHIQIRLDTS